MSYRDLRSKNAQLYLMRCFLVILFVDFSQIISFMQINLFLSSEFSETEVGGEPRKTKLKINESCECFDLHHK